MTRGELERTPWRERNGKGKPTERGESCLLATPRYLSA